MKKGRVVNNTRSRARTKGLMKGVASSFRLHPSSLVLVGVIMGSKSDWETMRAASETLERFGVTHECHVMSAHRTPGLASEFAATAESRGLEVIIAAAGGAAHL